MFKVLNRLEIDFMTKILRTLKGVLAFPHHTYSVPFRHTQNKFLCTRKLRWIMLFISYMLYLLCFICYALSSMLYLLCFIFYALSAMRYQLCVIRWFKVFLMFFTTYGRTDEPTELHRHILSWKGKSTQQGGSSPYPADLQYTGFILMHQIYQGKEEYKY